MQRLRLWTAGLVAQIDSIVGRIENHEAVASSTLRAAARAAARARVQLARVGRDGVALRQRLEEARENEARWRDRAIRLVANDEAQALECLRRRRAEERAVASLGERLREHEHAERALAADVAAVEERLRGLRERHHLLATRESRTTAVSNLPDLDSFEVFERWEMAVAEREITGGHGGEPRDAFAAEFERAEQESDLRAELEGLRFETVNHEEDSQ